MPRPMTLAILDHPKLRGPAISIRHDPAFGIAREIVGRQRRVSQSLALCLTTPQMTERSAEAQGLRCSHDCRRSRVVVNHLPAG